MTTDFQPVQLSDQAIARIKRLNDGKYEKGYESDPLGIERNTDRVIQAAGTVIEGLVYLERSAKDLGVSEALSCNDPTQSTLTDAAIDDAIDRINIHNTGFVISRAVTE